MPSKNKTGLSDFELERKAQSYKDEFVSVLSHKMRTPLAVVKQGIDLIISASYGELTEKQEEYLNISQKNVKRLEKIINDLSDLSKIQSGQVQLVREELDLLELFRQVVTFHRSFVDEMKLKIRYQIPKNKILLFVDRGRVYQIFSQLIQNAIKFTDEGEINITIKSIESKVECIIEDTGYGIAQEDLPKVFQTIKNFGHPYPFYNRGSGLGLVLCKSLVELHQGSISIESELGKGTKVFVSFPRLSNQELIKEKLQTKFENAILSGSHVSLIFFKNLEDKKKLKKEGAMVKKLEEMQLIIQSQMRGSTDLILEDQGNIYIFLQSNATTDLKNVRARLRQIAETFIEQNELKYLIKEHTAPDDLNSVEELFQKLEF